MTQGPEVELPHPKVEIIKTEPYPHQFMTFQLMRFWSEIPEEPAIRGTPVRELDLTAEGRGYGRVLIKDESDRSINPTGTAKDRFAELVCLWYGDYARELITRIDRGEMQESDLAKKPILFCSDISAGNEAFAIVRAFARYGLPPLKVLIDINLPRERLEKLKSLPISIYAVDLTHWLSPKRIRELTDNEWGWELTSIPQDQNGKHNSFYGSLPREVLFDTDAQDVFVPYGSAKLFDDLLFYQAYVDTYLYKRVIWGVPFTPRLNNREYQIVNVNIFGAVPADPNSIADKLNARYRYTRYTRERLALTYKYLHRSGYHTGIYPVEEEYILQAHEIMTRHGFDAELSAAAGLALYMQRVDTMRKAGKSPDFTRKVIIVNTGYGIDRPDAL